MGVTVTMTSSHPLLENILGKKAKMYLFRGRQEHSLRKQNDTEISFYWDLVLIQIVKLVM